MLQALASAAAVFRRCRSTQEGRQISAEICRQIHTRVFPFSLPVTASPWGWVLRVVLGGTFDAPGTARTRNSRNSQSSTLRIVGFVICPSLVNYESNSNFEG